MADISKEIQDFRIARKGKDVRNSMISLAEKVNKDGEDAIANVAAQVVKINGAITTANNAVTNANAANKLHQKRHNRKELGGRRYWKQRGREYQ